ncbi:MAG: RNA polymerase sigma-70 factor [Bacteroidales bacterium]|nr:RNA polymerase sigma-70 factor [Bacteroidales bacterium]
MTLKEQQLLRKIRKGDINSFEKLFHHFYPRLCSYAENLVKKEEIAEEVVQDIFYNIWKNRESLRISRSLQSYLYRSVYNNSMMYLRKTRREYFIDDRVSLEHEGDSPDPVQLMQYHEVSELVSRTIDDLPERTKEIFQLNRQEGLKYKEIADRLSISVKTVEANMGKALKALRNSLEKYEQE